MCLLIRLEDENEDEDLLKKKLTLTSQKLKTN
jgi:hypothetical protein